MDCGLLDGDCILAIGVCSTGRFVLIYKGFFLASKVFGWLVITFFYFPLPVIINNFLIVMLKCYENIKYIYLPVNTWK